LTEKLPKPQGVRQKSDRKGGIHVGSSKKKKREKAWHAFNPQGAVKQDSRKLTNSHAKTGSDAEKEKSSGTCRKILERVKENDERKNSR